MGTAISAPVAEDGQRTQDDLPGNDRQIIRVFVRKTSQTPSDPYAFVGYPPLPMFMPEASEVHVSVTFTWDVQKANEIAEAWRQHYPVVKVGGPALDSPSNEFIPGRYVRPGVTFTTRGCNNKCEFCLVPQREGLLREIENPSPGTTIQDNNFLQANKNHILKVCGMLRRQDKPVTFAGGLDARLLKPWHVDELRGLKIDQMFFACDHDSMRPHIERAASLLRNAFYKNRHGYMEQVRCYVLVGFWEETIEAVEDRLLFVLSTGMMPFAMLYQPPDRWIDYGPDWKTLQKNWVRPALIKMRNKGLSI